MIQRRLLLSRGVWPLLGKRAENTDEMLEGAIEAAVESNLISPGDVVVITAGISPNMPGSTDLMKVETVPVVLAQGIGVLEAVVSGRVRRLDLPTAVRADEIAPDEILVVAQSDRSVVPLIRRAAGLVSQQGGVGCHAHALAMELGIPAIVGVGDAFQRLEDGMQITMDTGRGLIYASQREQEAIHPRQ
jgi:pyruvate kinase